MRPVDPRLLRYARSTRGFLILAVALGAVVAALVIAQARLLSTAIVDVAQGGATLETVGGVLVALAAAHAAGIIHRDGDKAGASLGQQLPRALVARERL